LSVVVTVMNMKGGVGKTTVSMHLAGTAALYSIGADRGRKVLLIDYDPQFNLSQAFLEPNKYFAIERQRKTTIAILMDDDTVLNPYELQVPGNHIPPKVVDLVTNVFRERNGGRLDIIASTLDLMYVALGQSDKRTDPMEERFQRFIDACLTIHQFLVMTD
jgi:chromosome partitioning protein